MTAAWPAVSSKAQVGGFTEAPERNIAEFQPDVGPPKRRRRSSITNDLISFSQWYNSADWDTIRTFYRTTLLDGVSPFTMNHPRTGNSQTWIFVDVPKI